MKTLFFLIQSVLFMSGLHAQSSTGTSDTMVPPHIAEEMPVYTGGEDAMMKVIQANLNYPDDARDMNIQGRVVIGFVIDSMGRMDSIRVKQSVWPSMDREALRVVRLLQGHWKPGTQQGKPVKVWFMLPIMMRLSGDVYDFIYDPDMGDSEKTALRTLQMGKLENALKLYRELNARRPDNNFIAHNYGLCLYVNNDKPGAYAVWKALRAKGWHTADLMLSKEGQN